jgi:hypothetical protein
MMENGATERGYSFDPVKIFPKPHRFGVAPPRRSVRITLDFYFLKLLVAKEGAPSPQSALRVAPIKKRSGQSV